VPALVHRSGLLRRGYVAETILADYKLRGTLDSSQPQPGTDSYWPGRASS
jgi:hypothetical protein